MLSRRLRRAVADPPQGRSYTVRVMEYGAAFPLTTWLRSSGEYAGMSDEEILEVWRTGRAS